MTSLHERRVRVIRTDQNEALVQLPGYARFTAKEARELAKELLEAAVQLEKTPGEVIAARLLNLNFTAAEFARRMEYTPKHVNELLHGRAPITVNTAFRFELVLGGTALSWLYREARYREALARQKLIENGWKISRSVP